MNLVSVKEGKNMLNRLKVAKAEFIYTEYDLDLDFKPIQSYLKQISEDIYNLDFLGYYYRLQGKKGSKVHFFAKEDPDKPGIYVVEGKYNSELRKNPKDYRDTMMLIPDVGGMIKYFNQGLAADVEKTFEKSGSFKVTLEAFISKAQKDSDFDVRSAKLEVG